MQDSTEKVMAIRNTVWIHDKMNHDQCSHQTYIVDLEQDNDHSHDQVHCGSMMQYTYVSDLHNSNRSLGGEMITMKSPYTPGSSSSPNWYISAHVNKCLDVEHE